MVRVRPAVRDDLPRLVEIAGRSATAAQWKQDDYLRLFTPEPEQARTALVIEQDGSVMGATMSSWKCASPTPLPERSMKNGPLLKAAGENPITLLQRKTL